MTFHPASTGSGMLPAAEMGLAASEPALLECCITIIIMTLIPLMLMCVSNPSETTIKTFVRCECCCPCELDHSA